MILLQCSHSPRKYKMEFSDNVTGNYFVELCDNCHARESKEFLVTEEMIQ